MGNFCNYLCFYSKRKPLDLEFGKLSDEIKEHKKFVAKLNQEQRAKVEVDVLNKVMDRTYSQMVDKCER